MTVACQEAGSAVAGSSIASFRATRSRAVLGEDQKISREEALKLPTIDNERLTFDEKTIEGGRWPTSRCGPTI